jgi:alkylhydroperoxidase family enzyme
MRLYMKITIVVVAIMVGILPTDAPHRILAEPQTSPSGIDTVLPTDIDPNSLNRLTALSSDSQNTTQGVEAIRRRGVADARWASPLGRRLTELAILITGREHDQPYEWSLHELEAIAVGLDPEVIDAVRHRRPLTGLADREAVVIQLGRELFGSHELSSVTYARAVSLLGESNLVDLVNLMARYAGIAVRLTAFNQYMPPDWLQLLPLPFEQPDDIHPESRSRLSLLRNTEPAPQGSRDLYGRTLSPEGTGPGHIARHGAGLESLEASVGKPVVGLATLLTARALDSQYAWAVSEIAAREDGLEPAVIDVVRHRSSPTGLGEREAILVTFARELFDRRYVSAETYARTVDVFGERDLVDLVIVMGKEVGDIALLTVFDQRLPARQVRLFPLP